MNIKECLKIMGEKNASDLFYRAGGPARMRIDGRIVAVSDKELSVEDAISAVEAITTESQRQSYKEHLDVDFGLFLEDIKQRFRVSIFTQRNTPSIVIRQINRTANSFEEMGLPKDALEKLCNESRGLVLLTGSTGSGKSTTIASMIEYINARHKKHILTIEEPIEFTFGDKQSIINQRELGPDVFSYQIALKAFALQSPDVIYIGNIRDYETMATAMTAAETGVLVLSTLHTINAAQTVERIINFFPPYQHEQVAIQLSSLLKGVISLRLVPYKEKSGRIPAYESMVLTPTISRLIRERKVWEIPRYLQEGGIFGMQTFNQSLTKLFREEKISIEEAMRFSDNKDELDLMLKGIKK
ncbi:MAG: PilT/PilU family type 4a pilus ATPase [Candidatus Omnitrophota bacterium]